MPRTSDRTGGATDEKEQHGLFVLYPLSEEVDINMDIVFVHGLGGSKDKTWTADNSMMWPRDLVPQVIPTARVMTFGYDSRWAFSPSTADIKDFAYDLLNRLRSKRWSAEAMQRPIIFICHSLGGIVCKKALILAQSEKYYTNIFEKTNSIFFFGTPHRGSRVASWATVMSNFINTCPFYTPLRKQLLLDLSLSSTILADISASFSRLASNIEFKSFYETSRMPPLKGLVVEKDSAILGFPTEQRIPISANHREIVHFTSIESEKFDLVKTALQELKDGGARNVSDVRSTFTYLAGEIDPLGNYVRGELGAADYDQQLSEISLRAPGTCEWLALHPSFSEWMKSGSSDVLWLRGYPGVGKSVITKYLIMSVIGSTYVRSKRNTTPREIDVSFHTVFLAYFFCNEANAALRSESSILRAVLHQFLLAAPFEAAQVLLSLKSGVDNRYIFLNSISALWDAIKAVLVAISWKVTYLVFDALDEMTPESLHSFTAGLRDLVDTVSPHIMPRALKVLITSRPTIAIEQNLSPVSIAVKSERDVRHLIEGWAKDLAQRYLLSEKTHIEIVTRICEKAGSMFLWASLAWEQLCEGASKESQFLANLKKAEALPANLDALYENVLSRLDSHKLSLTLKALPWLLAATRPLHTNELRFAMALDTQADYSAVCSKMVKEATLRDLCPSLINVNERGYVSFAHSSIRDYLFHPKTTERFRFEPRAVHEKLAILCLQCLYLPGFNAEATSEYLRSQNVRIEDDMIDLVAQYYLLGYASANWYLHARLVGQSLRIWESFDTLLKNIPSVKLWLMLCLYDDTFLAQRGWSIDRDISPPPSIYLAVFVKNTYLVQMLVRERLPNNGINEINHGWENKVSTCRKPNLPEGGSVLHFQDLDLEMARCLVRLGADISVPDTSGQNPVQLAIHQHNQDLAVMLIECARERDPSALKNNARMLFDALDQTMPIVLNIILDDESIDLSNPSLMQEEDSRLGTYVTTPLEHACLFGMESSARFLMTHPRIIESQLKVERRPSRHNPTGVAFLTTLQGWRDLTFIALQNFPTNIVSERDSDRRTILHHAAMEEWHDVLDLCIEKLSSSKLNIQDKNGMTALHYAARLRNWYGSERLLDAGADALMEDVEGKTPGHSAAEAGSDRVLRLLLDKGAIALDHFDHYRRTVLHYAATWNLTSIVESIVELNPNSVEAKDRDGRTAAHMAALFGSTATLSLLLSTHLVDINSPDEHGRTLLHCAVESRITSCIDELLSRDGIKLNPLDRSLKSPLDVTASFKDESHTTTIQETLREAGCRPGLWRPRRSYGQAQEEKKEVNKRWHDEWQLTVSDGRVPIPSSSIVG